jgi:tetratricopeptide (TPR) repeat protein
MRGYNISPLQKIRSMTDDFEPVSDTPSPDPLPFDDEGDAIVESVEGEEIFLNPNGEFVLEIPISDPGTDEPYQTQAADSIWVRLRRAIFGGGLDAQSEHFQYLDQAIEIAPDTAANYVLRGELYLKVREYALARRDFQRAYELAAEQFERSDWGIIAQAMQDRALAGLQRAENKLDTSSDLA